MEVLALKQVEKTSTRDGKNWQLNSPKILCKTAPRDGLFIASQNIAIDSQLSSRSCCRSTGWSTGWSTSQRSNFWPLQPAGRPPGWPCLRLDLPVDRPVDRGQIQRAKLSGRSTAQSTVPQAKWSCMFLYTSVDRPIDRLLSLSTGRSTARRPGLKFWGLKLGLINSYKFP